MGWWKGLMIKMGFSKVKRKFLIVGLDNAGKTTMINWFRAERVLDVVPTLGYQVESFRRKKVHFTVVDMSGHKDYRDLWQQYYDEVHGIVFVMDASDRHEEAKKQLTELLEHPDVAEYFIPVLVMANKMDLTGALTPKETAKLLGLERIVNKPWHVCASNALLGIGIDEGFTWIEEQVK